MKKYSIWIPVFFLSACATGFNAASKISDLRTGMGEQQVREMLGNPAQVRRSETVQVWKYSLHANFKGWVPYYLTFTGMPPKLHEWYADEEEFRRNQANIERQWDPVIKALQQNNSHQTRPGLDRNGPTQNRTQGQSAECRNARHHEDRMCYCHSIC